MPGPLDDRTVLVTGAAAGIGRAIAERLLADGARVVLTDRDPAVETAIVSDRVVARVMDVTDEDAVAAVFDGLVADGVVPDVVVANAGVQLFGSDAPVARTPLDAWRRTIDVNLTGTFLTVRQAVRVFLQHGGGSVICIGSPTALNGEGADFAAYSASKGGIHALVRSTAMAYAADGVRANTVVPGYTETGLVRTIADDPAARAGIVARTPLGRAGTPADVAGVVSFLASADASFATGAEFRVDGGMTTL